MQTQLPIVQSAVRFSSRFTPVELVLLSAALWIVGRRIADA